MKNYRLVVDKAETRRALICFLKATQMISAHLASCHLSKCSDISEAELILEKERVFVGRRRPDVTKTGNGSLGTSVQW